MIAPGARRPVVWGAVGQGVLLAANLCRSVLLARLLDPAAFGRLLPMLSVATLAGAGLAGLATAGVRRVAASRTADTASLNVRGTVQVSLIGNAALLVATAGLYRLVGMSGAEAAGLAALLTVLLWIGLMSALARGLGHVVFVIQVEQVAVPIAQALAVAACVLRGRPSSLAFLMAAQAAGTLPLLALLARPVVAATRGRRLPVAPHLRREILIEAAPTIVTALVWRAMADAPLWAAGLAIGSSATAVFGAAQRIASVIQLPSAAVLSILVPATASLASRGQYGELEHRLRRGARIAAAGSAAGVLAIVAAGPSLPALIYGPYFAQAAPVIAVLGVAQLINSAAGLGGMTLQMIDQPRSLLALSCVSLAILAAIVWPLALALGVTGLAWAWLIAVVIQNLLMIRAVRRLTGMHVYMALR